jgi:hypothetical protein
MGQQVEFNYPMVPPKLPTTLKTPYSIWNNWWYDFQIWGKYSNLVLFSLTSLPSFKNKLKLGNGDTINRSRHRQVLHALFFPSMANRRVATGKIIETVLNFHFYIFWGKCQFRNPGVHISSLPLASVSNSAEVGIIWLWIAGAPISGAVDPFRVSLYT